MAKEWNAVSHTVVLVFSIMAQTMVLLFPAVLLPVLLFLELLVFFVLYFFSTCHGGQAILLTVRKRE